MGTVDKFIDIIRLGTTIAQQLGVFIDNFHKLRGTLNESQQAELDKIFNEIHDKNMQLSGEIDAAAAEAEKRT